MKKIARNTLRTVLLLSFFLHNPMVEASVKRSHSGKTERTGHKHHNAPVRHLSVHKKHRKVTIAKGKRATMMKLSVKRVAVNRHRRKFTVAWRVSFYGRGFAGRKTANGERFNPNGLTAAHRTLPFGTRLHVRNLKTLKSVVVRVTDRGPYIAGRSLDLSHGAARKVGLTGVDNLQVTVLSFPREGG